MDKAVTYIILLNHHGLEDTIECVRSLQKLASKAYKIVIVDNSNGENDWNRLIDFASVSSQSFIDFYEGKTPEYQQQSLVLIKALANKGFAQGNNLGLQFAIQQTDAHYFWILNNDTVVDSKSLSSLISYHSKHPETILGSKLVYYNAPDQIQAVGGAFDEKLYICTHIGEGFPKNTPKTKFSTIDYPVGASMFVNRKFVEETGFLNEEFFLYFEELDWVKRGSVKGYQPDWCEDSIVYHKEGKSIGSSYKHEKSLFSETTLFKSRKKFIEKYYSLNFKFYFSSLLLITNRLRKGKFRVARELIKITFNDVK